MSSSGPGPRVLSHLLFLSSSFLFLSLQRWFQSRNGWSQFSQIGGSDELVVASQPCGVSLILRLGTRSIVGEGGLKHTHGTDWQMQRVLMLSARGAMKGLELSSKSFGSVSKGRGPSEGEGEIGWNWLGFTSGDSGSGRSKAERLEEAAFLSRKAARRFWSLRRVASDLFFFFTSAGNGLPLFSEQKL